MEDRPADRATGARDVSGGSVAGDTAAARRRLEEVSNRLHSVAIALLRTVREADESLEVSPARLSALSVLVFGGARSLGELARAEQVTPPTMSRIVDGLERSGLARREPDPGDRRAVRVSATRAGRRVLARGRGQRVRVLAGRLAGLGARDLAALERAASILERRLPSGRAKRA